MTDDRKRTLQTNTYPLITMGKVVDTNDPKQMGRVRVLCPALGDSGHGLLGNLPWATYVSPLAGVVERGSRGRGDDTSFGPVAYGMWNIPKVGATALVACLDGDPRLRIYFGQIFGELLTHTLPHGRFSVQNTIADNSEETLIDVGLDDARPIGPFNSREEAIQPQYDTLQDTFTVSKDTVGAVPPETPQRNYEYFTRGADRSVSRLTEEDVFDENVMSFSRDDLDDPFHIIKPGDVPDSTQGYQQSRIQPNATSEVTGKVYDSQIYSWTTPGLHAIAMDDSPDNCRVRFRTTHGHQVILDDTNERIYIGTAGGKTWAEMDEKGNIDYYAKRNISFHAEEDFNITAKNIRMKADESIHIMAEGEMRIHSVGMLHVKTYDEFKLQSIGSLHIDTHSFARITANDRIDIKSIDGTLYVDTNINIDLLARMGDVIIEAGTDIHVTAGAVGYITTGTDFDIDVGAMGYLTTASDLHMDVGGSGYVTAASELHLTGGTDANLTAGSGNANILAGGNVLLTGSQVHVNGSPATSATAAAPATPADPSPILIEEALHALESWWTNRVPEHEPWPRVMTKVDVTDTGGDVDNTNPALMNTHTESAEYLYDDPEVSRTERGVSLNRNDNWKR